MSEGVLSCTQSLAHERSWAGGRRLRAVGPQLAAASRARLRLGLLLHRGVRQLPYKLRVPVELRDPHPGDPTPYTRNPKP